METGKRFQDRDDAEVLETFLVEWKLEGSRVSHSPWLVLETFLVEWKPEMLLNLANAGVALKPS